MATLEARTRAIVEQIVGAVLRELSRDDAAFCDDGRFRLDGEHYHIKKSRYGLHYASDHGYTLHRLPWLDRSVVIHAKDGRWVGVKLRTVDGHDLPRVEASSFNELKSKIERMKNADTEWTA